jgi:hypothetical protein
MRDNSNEKTGSVIPVTPESARAKQREMRVSLCGEGKPTARGRFGHLHGDGFSPCFAVDRNGTKRHESSCPRPCPTIFPVTSRGQAIPRATRHRQYISPKTPSRCACKVTADAVGASLIYPRPREMSAASLRIYCPCLNPTSLPPPPELPSSSHPHHEIHGLYFCEECDSIRCNRCVASQRVLLSELFIQSSECERSGREQACRGFQILRFSDLLCVGVRGTVFCVRHARTR